ncbi:hypothetical protein OIU74_001576 [Salix koriyanagi]|uniref:Uncharacterized protein n=1 Tax=Salix koriyanagi TaxID=2511006 RepID=A0A9Q0X1Q1_9ROSI|nr:hypothetical protein OIU74_001576 [Salix koriyanagi]
MGQCFGTNRVDASSRTGGGNPRVTSNVRLTDQDGNPICQNSYPARVINQVGREAVNATSETNSRGASFNNLQKSARAYDPTTDNPKRDCPNRSSRSVHWGDRDNF